MIGIAWELFRRYDRNRNERLELDEFQFTADAKNISQDVLFRLKDKNRDGRLLLSEIFTLPKPATDDATVLERYDARLARAKQRFERDDTDKSGALDVAEFIRARQLAAKTLQETPGEYATRLFVADSDGSNMKQLMDLPEFTSQGSPNWSSDGKFIAFDGRMKNGPMGDQSQILIVQADGKNPRVIRDGMMPSFTPRGNRVAFSNSSSGGVWVTSAQEANSELFEIDRNGWGNDWSRDGRLVYASHGRGGANLAILNPVEGQTDFLFDETKSPYQQILWNMAWSPDSKRIVFKGVNKAGKDEVGIIDARGEKFGFIKRFEGTILASFAWSPLENRILFIMPDPDTGRTQIYYVDPDTKDPPRLLPGQDELRDYTDIAYSPDGKRIVCSSRKPAYLE